MNLIIFVSGILDSLGRWILTNNILEAIAILISVTISAGFYLKVNSAEEELEIAGGLLITTALLFAIGIVIGLVTSIYLITALCILSGLATFIIASLFILYNCLWEYLPF